MDITQAKQTLEIATSSPNTPQGLVPILKMSLDLLNETFKPEFTSIENAQKEANDKVLEVNTLKAQVVEKEADIVVLNKSLVAKEVEVQALKAESISVITEDDKSIPPSDPVVPLEVIPE